MDAVLAFDIGTSAVKSSIIDTGGHIVDVESYDNVTLENGKGYAEQDPAKWWEGACATTRRLLDRNPEYKKTITAIGVSGHMLGCLPVDSEGQPLSHAMIHSDTRAASEADGIRSLVGADKLYQWTGNVLNAQSPLCKMMWLKKNEPSVYNRTARFMQSKDFLTSRLTGNIDTTDYSDASHAQWINIHNKTCLNDMLRTLGLDADKFPALYKGTDIAGFITTEAARALSISSGIPVIAGGGDGSCATAGAGITRQSNDFYACLGTTAWIAHLTKEPVIDPHSRLFNLVSLDGEHYVAVGTVQSAGKSIHWARVLFNQKSSRELDKEAANAPPGSDGLVFLPYLDGERSPIFDDNAKGVFFGINSRHNRTHFMRATVEGVSFALRSVLDVFRENMHIPSLRLIGGGARSTLWQQILADICQMDMLITDTRTDAVTSLGVALAACVGIGVYASLDEAMSVVGVARTTEPVKGNAGIYDGLYDIYRRLYPVLRGLF